MRVPEIGFLGVTDKYYSDTITHKDYRQALDAMRSLCGAENIGLCARDAPLGSRAELLGALDEFRQRGVSALAVHCTAFAQGELASELASFVEQHPKPMLFWGFPEPLGGAPQVGGLVCVNFYCNTFAKRGLRYRWLFGAPTDEEHVRRPFRTFLRAVNVIQGLRAARVGLIGGRAPGFFLCDFDGTGLKRRFGVTLEYADLSSLFRRANTVSDADVQKVRDEFLQQARCDFPHTEILQRSLRVFVAARRLAEEQGFTALGIKCWPEFLEEYGGTACLALALLNQIGIPTADEGDALGVVSMLASRHATGGRHTPTLLDLPAFDESRNTLHFWHCGATPPVLAQPGKPVRIIEQPVLPIETESTKKFGCGFETAIRGGPVTICRFGETDGRRLLVLEGEAIEAPIAIRGAHTEVRLPERLTARQVLNEILTNGWEHHFSLTHTHHADILQEACFWTDVAVTSLTRDYT